MQLLEAIINANKEWAARAGVRWGNAANAINNGTYDASQFFKDLLQSAVNDPGEWVADVQTETQKTGLIINAKGLSTAKSGFISVRHPAQTKVSSFARLGGTEQMIEGTHVHLDQPATPAGTVVVRLDNLSAGAHPAGQYLGFLYEDLLPISYIVVQR